LPSVATAQIAFASDREGTFDVHVTGANGRNVTRVTDDSSSEISPVWSPRASKIAYSAYTYGGGQSGIWVVAATGPRRPERRDSRLPLGLSWRPSGGQWATMRHKSNSGEEYQVALVDVDTGRRRTLAPQMILPAPTKVSWSPTGSRIVAGHFIVEERTAGFYRWIDDISPGSVDWSQDGSMIAFHYGIGTNGEIYVASVAGMGLRTIVDHPARDRDPTWSADGREIAFTSERDGNSEVYVVNVETGALRNLTRHPAEDRNPDWAPDMKLLSIFAKEVVTWGWMKGFRRPRP